MTSLVVWGTGLIKVLVFNFFQKFWYFIQQFFSHVLLLECTAFCWTLWLIAWNIHSKICKPRAKNSSRLDWVALKRHRQPFLSATPFNVIWLKGKVMWLTVLNQAFDVEGVESRQCSDELKECNAQLLSRFTNLNLFSKGHNFYQDIHGTVNFLYTCGNIYYCIHISSMKVEELSSQHLVFFFLILSEPSFFQCFIEVEITSSPLIHLTHYMFMLKKKNMFTNV